MKTILKTLLAFLCIILISQSCKKSTTEITVPIISQDVISSIKAMGFSTNGIIQEEGGYIVEGDIFIPTADLKRSFSGSLLRIGGTEQYSTTNLVTVVPGVKRNITLKLSSKINASVYGPVLDEVVKRYNDQFLNITFSRVSSSVNANITFDNANGQYLASAGFPTSTGDPYKLVKVNTRAIGSVTSATFVNYAATIFAHELGHCIGFRHTDYMDRSYSCNGSPYNEGDGGVGAIYITGTATGPDEKSFMLACIGANENRQFNQNDILALNALYKK